MRPVTMPRIGLDGPAGYIQPSPRVRPATAHVTHWVSLVASSSVGSHDRPPKFMGHAFPLGVTGFFVLRKFFSTIFWS